jgi:hypothetical protein
MRYEKEFEELSELGRGGFGRVVAARHAIDGQVSEYVFLCVCMCVAQRMCTRLLVVCVRVCERLCLYV